MMFLNQSGFSSQRKKQYRKPVVSSLIENRKNQKNGYFFIKFKFQVLQTETAQFLNSMGFYNKLTSFFDL
jgi:hypothetical protein